MKGYIYILSNASMPGLVKIGHSIHGGAKRAKQLNTTGVPMPFVLVFELYTDDYEFIEKNVHDRLVDRRVNGDREFFRIETWNAIATLTSVFLEPYGFTVADQLLMAPVEELIR